MCELQFFFSKKKGIKFMISTDIVRRKYDSAVKWYDIRKYYSFVIMKSHE